MYSHLASVEHAIDAQGFVLVGGVRVLNVPGQNLKALTATAPCQRCADRIAQPLRVVSEYEAAIDAVRYFHAPVAGSPTLCGKCGAK
jgi:hypothetical protein